VKVWNKKEEWQLCRVILLTVFGVWLYTSRRFLFYRNKKHYKLWKGRANRKRLKRTQVSCKPGTWVPANMARELPRWKTGAGDG